MKMPKKKSQPNVPPKKDENKLTIKSEDIEKKTRKPLDTSRAATFDDKRTKRNRTRANVNKNEIDDQTS